MKYGAKIVINTGLAGALSNDLHLGDIAIATGVVQHDFDISPLGWEKNIVPMGRRRSGAPIGEKSAVEIKVPRYLVDIIRNSCESCGLNYKEGTIATGDIFVASTEIKRRIVDRFGAIACEMEGGSVGQVCSCLLYTSRCV